MAENNNPVSEPLQKTGQAASAAVNTARATAKFAKGAAKLGKSIAAAAKGASAGGVWGAVAAFAWENRRLILKITIAASAVLLIPILIICMLPNVIFNGLEQPYSLDNKEALILNDSTVISSNIDKIYTSLGSIMSEAKEDILSEIEDAFEDSEATQKEIIDSHPRLTDQNVMSFVSQYSASKSQDWRSVSISDMDNLLSSNKGKLYSYTTSYEDRKRTVYNEYDDIMSELKEELLMHELAKKLSPRAMRIVRMKVRGDKMHEIAKAERLTFQEINRLLDSIYPTVRKIFYG